MDAFVNGRVAAAAVQAQTQTLQHRHGSTGGARPEPERDQLRSMRPDGRSDAFASEMEAGMKKMMEDMHASGYSGNPDVDFLAMMIPHHQGAVEMARLVLIHGGDPLTRGLAEDIIASQTAEISAMTERLNILRRGEDAEPGGFPALHGTRGTAPK
jgi:hypothetical protein